MLVGKRKVLTVLTLFLLTVSFGGCAFVQGVSEPERKSSVKNDPGVTLYDKHCAGCHKPIERTNVFGRTASRIRSSFTQFPVMAGLRTLSDDDLRLIAKALLLYSPED